MTTCVDVLGPGPDNVLCPPEHCASFQESSMYHAVCDCVDWQGNPIPDCSPKDSLYPVQSGECYNPQTDTWQETSQAQCVELGMPWYFRTCYCCCGGSAATVGVVAAAEGEQSLAETAPGDAIATGARGAGGALEWTPATVALAGGDDAPAPAVRVRLAGGGSTVAAAGQLFLQPDGRLKRADQLEPGVDTLVGADGTPVAVESVDRGSAAVRHVAVALPSYEDFGGPDGHLIARDGVVVGDYVTQLYQGTEKMSPYLAGAPPAAPAPAAAAAPAFTPAAGIPANAVRLFDAAQSAQLAKATATGPATPSATVDYYARAYAGFYPGVAVSVAAGAPNVYAFSSRGHRQVVITQGLLRLGVLHPEGVALAVAFGIAALVEPDAPGSRVAQSAYYALGGVMLTALGPSYIQVALKAQQQWGPLLAQLHDPVAACIGEAIDAAISGADIPPCALAPVTSTAPGGAA